MAVDVKSVAIKVSAQGIKKAANDLAELSKAAKTFDVQSATAFKQLADFTQLSFQGVAQSLRDSREAIQGFKAITSKEAGKGLSNSVSSMANAFDRLKERRADIDAFIAQIDRLKTGMAELAANGAVSIRLNAAQGGASSGTRYQTDDAEKFAKTQQRLLAQMEREAVFVERGKTGWLEYRAAQLGVSEQAAPFVARMRAAQNAVQGTTVSTRALNATLRQVPAQFTDIATQLAGGQNPMLVLLQQGGQLADSFRMVGVGLTGMLKQVGGMVLRFLVNPFVLATGAVAGFALVAYKSAQGLSDFNKAVALTNNYIGLSTEDFGNLSARVGGMTGNVGKAEQAITAFAATGKITGQRIEEMVAATLKFASATGTSLDKVVEEYVSLRKGPTEALIKLNEQYHFLNASQLEQVRSLEMVGQTTRAVEIAQGLLARAHEDMAAKTLASMGTMERGWYKLKEGVLSYWDAVLNQGRDATKEAEAFDNANRNVIKAINDKEKAMKLAAQTGRVMAQQELDRYDATINKYREHRDMIVKARQDRGAASAAETARKEEEDRLISARQYADTVTKTLSVKAKVAAIDRQIASIRNSATKAADDPERILGLEKERTRLINEAQDKGAQASVDRLASLKAERQAIEADIAGLLQYGAGYDKVTENAQKLFAINNALADTRTDSKKRQELLQDKALLEQIVPLEARRAELIEQTKTVAKWDEQTNAARSTIEALKEQADEMTRTGDVQSRMTATEKALIQAKRDLTTARGFDAVASAKDRVLALEEQVSQEALNKSIAEANKLRLETLKVGEQGAATLASMVAQYQFEANSINMSNRERQKAQQLMQLEASLKQQIAPLEAQLVQMRQAGSNASKEEIAALEALIAKRREMATQQEQLIQQQGGRKKLEGSSVLNDARTAYDNFYDSLQTRQDLFQEAFNSSYSLMSDAISDFVTTGKLDFKSFTADVMKMIAQMTTKMLILKAIQYGTNYFMPSNNLTANQAADMGVQRAKGGAYAKGGTEFFAKGGTFTNTVVSSPTPFRFAKGGGFGNGLMGEAGPEAIMPLKRGADGSLGVQAAGGGNTNVVINVNVQSDGSTQTTTQGTSEQDGKRLGELIKQSVINVILDQKRPGGVLQSVA